MQKRGQATNRQGFDVVVPENKSHELMRTPAQTFKYLWIGMSHYTIM